MFKPCVWLANGHLQTWAGAFIPRDRVHTEKELIPLVEDDVLELHHLPATLPDAPIIVLLHGLEGSVYSNYIQGMLNVAKKQQFRAVVPLMRGSGGRINRVSQSYHAGRTDDIEVVLAFIRKRYPLAPMVAIGYSLGANILLKFLGEKPLQNYLKAAIAVCAPFDLAATTARLQQGIGKIYERRFVRSLKQTVALKMALNMPMPLAAQELAKIKTLEAFDDKVTAPLHDFLNAQDYYQQTSCKHFLADIQTPTLIINAKDDPIIPKEVIPKQTNAHILLDIQEHGGHVGFIRCRGLGKLDYWLEQRTLNYIMSYLR